jgi:cob(I)alamin adenosyltransferase
MSITTKHGDAGRTRLLFGAAVSKDDPAIAAVGDADELNAALGLARIHVRLPDVAGIIARAQGDIVGLMGQLSAGEENAGRYAESGFRGIDQNAVDRLTTEGAALEAEFPDGFHTWSVPGASGIESSARLEFARCVCRRAERSVAALTASGRAVDAAISAWFNRLGDVLWLCARAEERPPRS